MRYLKATPDEGIILKPILKPDKLKDLPATSMLIMQASGLLIVQWIQMHAFLELDI